MKQNKLKFISITIGLVISFFLAEVVTRIYFFGGAAFSYSKTNSFGILDNSGLLKYSTTEGLIYELLPNLDTKYKLVDFRTNQEGFRDKNHALETSSRKVAILGDSFTMGTGVAEEDLYVQQTKKLLSESDTKNSYEFFNFGVSGYALNNYINILQKNTLKYQPDLVVIGFCAANDHYELGNDFSLDDFKIKPKKNVFWDSYLKKLIQIKLRKKQAPIIYQSTQMKYVNKQFEELQKLLKAHNIKGIILYMDLVYDAIRVSKIKELALQNDLLFLDTSHCFKNKDLNQYILNKLDPHPNNKANIIFAKQLKDFILKHEQVIFNN